jgi:hypothetical protein
LITEAAERAGIGLDEPKPITLGEPTSSWIRTTLMVSGYPGELPGIAAAGRRAATAPLCSNGASA